jgi:hypothetical protein
MTADQRRTFLFGLTKLKPNAEAVKARMIDEVGMRSGEGRRGAAAAAHRVPIGVRSRQEQGHGSEGRVARADRRDLRRGEGAGLGGTGAGSAVGDVDQLPTRWPALTRTSPRMNENLGAIKNAARAAPKMPRSGRPGGDPPARCSLVDQLDPRAKRNWPPTAEGRSAAPARRRQRAGGPGARHGRLTAADFAKEKDSDGEEKRLT